MIDRQRSKFAIPDRNPPLLQKPLWNVAAVAVFLAPNAQFPGLRARLLSETEACYAKLKFSRNLGLPFGPEPIRPPIIPTTPYHQQTTISSYPTPEQDYLAMSGISLCYRNVYPLPIRSPG